MPRSSKTAHHGGMAWKKASGLLWLASLLVACAPVAGPTVRLTYTGTIDALASRGNHAGPLGVLPFQDARIATGPTVGLALNGDQPVQLEVERRVPVADRLTDETVALLTRSGLPVLRLDPSGEPALSAAPGPALLLQGIIVEFDLRTEPAGPGGPVVQGEANVLLRFLDPTSRRALAGKLMWSVVRHKSHGREVLPADYQAAAETLWGEVLKSIGAAVPLDLLERAPPQPARPSV